MWPRRSWEVTTSTRTPKSNLGQRQMAAATSTQCICYSELQLKRLCLLTHMSYMVLLFFNIYFQPTCHFKCFKLLEFIQYIMQMCSSVSSSPVNVSNTNVCCCCSSSSSYCCFFFLFVCFCFFFFWFFFGFCVVFISTDVGFDLKHYLHVLSYCGFFVCVCFRLFVCFLFLFFCMMNEGPANPHNRTTDHRGGQYSPLTCLHPLYRGL